MKEELQLDHSMVDRIFPCLDELLEMHRQFFCKMKDRRQESCEAGSERNFVISRIGDILVQQVGASVIPLSAQGSKFKLFFFFTPKVL